MTELPKGKCGLAVWLLPALWVWEWLFTGSLFGLARGQLSFLTGLR